MLEDLNASLRFQIPYNEWEGFEISTFKSFYVSGSVGWAKSIKCDISCKTGVINISIKYFIQV